MSRSIDTGESYVVIGSDHALGVLSISGDGIASRDAWVWNTEGRMQVQDLAGGALVNGHSVEKRVEVEYPA